MPYHIFISYRSDDTLNQAGYLHLSLENHFGAGTVFYDKVGLKPGMKWPKELEEKVREAKVVLMLYGIAKLWLWVDEYGIRRIDDPEDWVRRELETALDTDKILIPVLVRNAPLPPEKALPPSLHPLLKCQHKTIREAEWGNDLAPLLQEIEKYVPRKTSPGAAPRPHDPLEDLPLPDPPALQPPPLPYKGLNWFTEADARIFFGREEEIAELYKTKLENPFQRIILFYGQSGAGKSSLLHAGLTPRLVRQGWQPTYRRRSNDGDTGSIVANYLEGLKTSPAERPLLIIDQLEEMITNPKGKPDEELLAFPALLRQLLDASPQLRVLLSFREDYLSPITDMLNKGGISYLEQRLKVMNESGLRRAVAGIPGTALKTHYLELDFAPGEDHLPERIAQDLCALEDSRSNASPLLQFVLLKMWEKVTGKKGSSNPVFSWALYMDHRQRSVTALVKEQVDELRATHKEAVENGLVWDVLRYFVTRESTAGQRSLDELIKRYGRSQESMIVDLCRALRDQYLLSSFQLEDGRPGYRLAHDALAPAVQTLFTESSAPGQRARLLLESKKNEISGFSEKDPLFTRIDLDILRDGIPGMYALPEDWEAAIRRAERHYEEERLKEERLRRDIASFCIRAAKEHILGLEYEKAYQSVTQALGLDMLREELAAVLIEIAFVEAEGSNRQLVLDCLARLEEINGKAKPEEALLSLQGAAFAEGIHALLESMQPELVRDLLRPQYFPDMVSIPAGKFLMGEEKDVHEVSLSRFALAKTSTTWWQYYLFCIATERPLPESPGWGHDGDNPVVNVSWYDVVEYANWLSGRLQFQPLYSIDTKTKDPNNENNIDDLKWLVTLRSKSNGYRLPTEAEWEYAARGEEKFPYSGSDDIDQVAWYAGNSGNRTRHVGAKKPNKWGLHDMSGNVWEWCWDWYGDYPSTSQTDPVGPGKGSARVLRGGSWSSTP